MPWPGQERRVRVPTPGQRTPRPRPSRRCPSPELMVLGLVASRPGHLPGLRATERGAGSRRPPPPSGPWARGPPTFSPLTQRRRRRKRKKEVLAPHPDSSLLPQTPWTATAAGNAASSHLPGAQPGNTLFMLSQPSRPHPPEAQFQPRAQGGRRGSPEGRATHKRGRPGPQPFASSPRGAACTFPP